MSEYNLLDLHPEIKLGPELQKLALQERLEEKRNKQKFKRCNKCGQIKSTKEFRFDSSAYLRPECKECEKKDRRTRDKLKKIYGKNPPPGYRCPICGKSDEELPVVDSKPHQTKWVIDHDHRTGEFRGHICRKCNEGLGVFFENIESLKNAILYLEKHNAKPITKFSGQIEYEPVTVEDPFDVFTAEDPNIGSG